ncbi:MAG: carboxypeptidase-like regulatory domain-containing protein [Candidatus Marinimicrobia bacterium]|nr:carboxypeptidase-like regulatory domain-containing protein [Candidatus Neomarinimicrobiota bacterium]
MNKLALILSVVILCSGLTAQTVSGSVTDGNGNPLPGANVSLGGTEKGAATDATGAYTISEVSQGSYTLTASYIGYEDQSKGINVAETDGTVVVIKQYEKLVKKILEYFYSIRSVK